MQDDLDGFQEEGSEENPCFRAFVHVWLLLDVIWRAALDDPVRGPVLVEALGSLRSRRMTQALVVTMRRILKYPVKDVARLLKEPETLVKVWEHRGLRYLRHYLTHRPNGKSSAGSL